MTSSLLSRATKAAAAQELSREVVLRRPSRDTWMPLGVLVDEHTMRLYATATGSIAERCEPMRSCVGMFLVEICGTPVHTCDQIVAAAADRTAIAFSFNADTVCNSPRIRSQRATQLTSQLAH